jgi:hypothetical protein
MYMHAGPVSREETSDMATKTISIDMEAYRRLKSARRDRESFSTVIKRTVRPSFDVRAYLDGLDAAPMSAAGVKATEEHVNARRAVSGRER